MSQSGAVIFKEVRLKMSLSERGIFFIYLLYVGMMNHFNTSLTEHGIYNSEK